jgi:hypothetical protein
MSVPIRDSMKMGRSAHRRMRCRRMIAVSATARRSAVAIVPDRWAAEAPDIYRALVTRAHAPTVASSRHPNDDWECGIAAESNQHVIQPRPAKPSYARATLVADRNRCIALGPKIADSRNRRGTAVLASASSRANLLLEALQARDALNQIRLNVGHRKPRYEEAITLVT